MRTRLGRGSNCNADAVRALNPPSLTYFLIGGDARREGTTAVFSLSSIYISAENDGRAAGRADP